MRELYAQPAAEADVVLYGFVDDLRIVGSPAEVVKALTALQRLLPAVSLRCNTAKSCLAYFHDDTAPLPASLLRTLAEQDIAVRHDWMEVMRAVVGRDSEAVKQGLDCLAARDSGSEAFFRRLQSPELRMQSALLVLRQCAVPSFLYAARCRSGGSSNSDNKNIPSVRHCPHLTTTPPTGPLLSHLLTPPGAQQLRERRA